MIEERLAECLVTMHRRLSEFGKISIQAARAKVAFEVREAEIISDIRSGDTKMTVREMEAQVALLAHDEMEEYERLEARSKALLEAVRCSRAELSALQTLAGLAREEAGLSRVAPET